MKRKIIWFIAAVAVVGSGAFSACSDYTEDIQSPGVSGPGKNGASGDNQLPADLQKPNEGEFSVEKMLVNIGLNVILKNVDEFYVETRRFKRDVYERCVKLEAGVNTPNHLKRVQEQWKRVMLAYHRLDAAPVGPLMDGEKASVLANDIYSWPLVNYCGIDLEVARGPKGTGSKELTNNKKGLAALEYALFAPNDRVACGKAILYKDANEWVAKTDIEKHIDRCHFEERLADDLEVQAKTLFAAWDVSQNNFSKTLVDGSFYPDTKAAVNALTDALFSIETIKDVKLGMPLGIVKGCDDASGLCPDRTEHILSGLAFDSIEAQVSAFKEVFYGDIDPKTKAFGLDDYLVSKGHQSVVDDFAKELDVVQASIDNAKSLEIPLKDMVAATEKATCNVGPNGETFQPACQLFIDIRQLTNLLKSELLTVLALEAPAGFQGDND